MVLGRIALALAAPVLVAAADPPPAPPALEPYIEDGALQPGDYAWLKGRFADASEQDKADLRAIDLWMSQCIEAAKAEIRRELAARGYPDAKLETALVGPLACRQALFRPNLPNPGSFAEFAAQAETGTAAAEAFLMAVRMAEEVAGPRGPELSDELLARPLGEQLVRLGQSWGQGPAADAPELTPAAREVVRARLVAAMAVRDTANTEWLKDVVARGGWPGKSQVGEKAANEAWLLVQHADHDPVFQLDALRLMEPLVAAGEVSARDFAYLYDRVMLKIAGKQRYGTQFTCVEGSWGPQPIEDEAAVARLRSEAGMETLAENTARMDATYGRC